MYRVPLSAATCLAFMLVDGFTLHVPPSHWSGTQEMLRQSIRPVPFIASPLRGSITCHHMAVGDQGDLFDEMSDLPEEDEKGSRMGGGDPVAEAMAASSPFEDHIPRLNIVTLSGRVGNDPEPRYFDDGKVVLNLSLAVQRKYHPLERKVRNIKYGEEETDWFPLELWGRDAEFASNFVDKGARIGITGSLMMDSWEDRNTGEPRTKHKILVKHLDILETRAEAEARRSRNRGGGYSGYYDDKSDDRSNSGSGGFFDD
uniref:Single-stranded DNA-binding protein n=1 Tax=Pseudictyota dubia TaxID=2749911 RepID=A0A7R9W4H7_9STRA|mmetsp:Transcript_3243/g.5698  ORF Transcript_3243/g.5698 Transcript_3243/m.5698 type:complete len:258 (+) Transcript_3243:111-884(+)